MTEAEVRSFCSRYLPSYDAYSPKLSDKGMPKFVEPKRTLNFKLDENRAPYVEQIKPKIEDLEPEFIKVGNKYIKNQKKRMVESKIPSD